MLWKSVCAMHLSYVFLILALILELFAMRLPFVVELSWSRSMVMCGILWSILANDSPVLSVITQLLIVSLLLLNLHWKSGGSFWLAKDFYFWLIMLLSLIYTRLPLFLGGMHVGWTFWVSSILRFNTSKVVRMLLLMCCPVYLELRSCLLLCYVLWHTHWVCNMLMMFLLLLRAVPWLHLWLPFMRMIHF